ncbi:MAG: prepilin-type N-terminal cleavage/methylation domain-containing protein [Alphaproteobacteria bacterium]|nr:prepilin-type N-terminal cleavage/methylation domain-containing protein [Alphaproteobacteria bacterium]
MKSIHTQKGFTLVELAIVMTIIGLLIGGILKGQELMENARVTSTVAQVKSYEAAVTTFRDAYNAMPGDMPNTANRLPGCAGTICEPTAAGQFGNGIVGATGWGTAGFTAQMAAPANGAFAAVGGETQLFWVHLLKADLIAGVTDSPTRAAGQLAWGDSHPAGRIGGGFVAGFGDGARGPGATGALPGVTGAVVALVQNITVAPGTTAGLNPLTPARAAQIDRRIDDGRPTTGYVQAYGVAASCFGPAAANAQYIEATISKDCGLIFRIQG